MCNAGKRNGCSAEISCSAVWLLGVGIPCSGEEPGPASSRQWVARLLRSWIVPCPAGLNCLVFFSFSPTSGRQSAFVHLTLSGAQARHPFRPAGGDQAVRRVVLHLCVSWIGLKSSLTQEWEWCQSVVKEAATLRRL